MALSHYVTYATGVTGAQASQNLDPSISPFTVTAAVFLVSTGTYGLEYTLDPIDVADASCRWFPASQLPTGTTAAGTQAFTAPITKVRINIAANGTGIELKTLQGFTQN